MKKYKNIVLNVKKKKKKKKKKREKNVQQPEETSQGINKRSEKQKVGGYNIS